MNLRTTLAFFFAVIVSSSCFAQQAQQYPACLLNPIEEYESGSLLTEINGTIRDYWFVYSSQADNKGYTNSDLSQVFKNYNFLDCFYVLEEQSDLLLVLEYGWVKYGQLAEGWQEHSCWFPKSALLLWRNCLIDPNSNANDPKINLPRKKTYYINRKIQEAAYNQGFFSKSKQDKQFKLEAPQNLSSYFVYKIQGEWVLLGKTPEIDDIKNASEYIPGWVHSENLIEWNGYLAFELNWENAKKRELMHQPVKLFKEIHEAQQFGNDAAFLSKHKENNLFIEDAFNSARPMGWEGRFMILNDLQEHENIYHLAFINDAGQIVSGYSCYHPNWSEEPLLHYVAFVRQEILEEMQKSFRSNFPEHSNFPMSQLRGSIYDLIHQIIADDLSLLTNNELINNTLLGQCFTLLTGLPAPEKLNSKQTRSVLIAPEINDGLILQLTVDFIITFLHIESILKQENQFNIDGFKRYQIYLFECLERNGITISYAQHDNFLTKLNEKFRPYDHVYSIDENGVSRYPLFILTPTDQQEPSSRFYWLDTRIFPTQDSRGSDIVLEVANGLE